MEFRFCSCLLSYLSFIQGKKSTCSLGRTRRTSSTAACTQKSTSAKLMIFYKSQTSNITWQQLMLRNNAILGYDARILELQWKWNVKDYWLFILCVCGWIMLNENNEEFEAKMLRMDSVRKSHYDVCTLYSIIPVWLVFERCDHLCFCLKTENKCYVIIIKWSNTCNI